MQTIRFDLLRKKDIKAVFNKKIIPGIWRDRVKKQLRSAAILDLFDYYDFNYDIDEKSKNISDVIAGGLYRPNIPLYYRLEKKLGITRLLVLPHPTDCLILEIIISSFFKELINKSPSEKAYFVRTNSPKSPDEFEGGSELSWIGQWKKFQKEILQFNKEFEFITVTDLSNYYDSIDILELKSFLLSKITIPEVIADILFYIIAEITWKPDYLPYRDRGLPTANIDAIRLLAHIFLFEVDSYLKETSNNNYVRWMDDIVIGCKDISKAKEMLNSISSLLMSRGLALNLAKTSIIDADEVRIHYQVEENKVLNDYQNLIKKKKKINKIEINSNFKKILKDDKPKLWDKIVKRYITIFSQINSNFLIQYSAKLFIKYPSLRSNIAIYLSQRGFLKEVKNIIKELVEDTKYYDDVTYFTIAKLLTDLDIPRTKENLEYLNYILNKFPRMKVPLDFYSQLWVRTKYDSNQDLLKFIEQFENFWIKYPFLHRQVVASTIRIYIPYKQKIESLYHKLISTGSNDSIMLIKQNERFRNSKKIEPKVMLYLFPKRETEYFELSRFLVICSFLNIQDDKVLKIIKEKCITRIVDKTYQHWLKMNYEIVFD